MKKINIITAMLFCSLMYGQQQTIKIETPGVTTEYNVQYNQILNTYSIEPIIQYSNPIRVLGPIAPIPQTPVFNNNLPKIDYIKPLQPTIVIPTLQFKPVVNPQFPHL